MQYLKLYIWKLGSNIKKKATIARKNSLGEWTNGKKDFFLQCIHKQYLPVYILSSSTQRLRPKSDNFTQRGDDKRTLRAAMSRCTYLHECK